MLVLHRIKPDWTSGKVEILKMIFLHDPDKKILFQIALEGTPKRYLTGAHLDVESFQTYRRLRSGSATNSAPI